MWTRFTNIYPVLGRPEPILFAYIEAPMKKAKLILASELEKRGLISGGLVAADEHHTLLQATGYERGCPCLYNPLKRTWFWTEPGEKYTNNLIFYSGYGKYENLEEFRQRNDVLICERSYALAR